METRRGLLLAGAIGCTATLLALVGMLAWVAVLSAGDDEPGPQERPRVWALHGTTGILLAGAATASWVAWRRAPRAVHSVAVDPAGTVLLLVGSIVHVGALVTLFGITLWPFFMSLGTEGAPVVALGLWLVPVLGTCTGVALGFVAWAQARRGVASSAPLGVAASLLPPVQVFTLIGAILVARGFKRHLHRHP